MTLGEIKAQFVDRYPDNKRRRQIYDLLEQFVQMYLVSGISCEIWLDGSFLTEKESPDDLDVTVILDADVPNKLSEDQQRLIDDTTEGRVMSGVDSFAFTKRTRDDPFFGDEHLDPVSSWGEQYGSECSEQWLKGFVVIKVRETNVGLRICS